MRRAFGWIGMVCTFAGVGLQTVAFGTNVVGYSFLIFLVSGSLWLGHGIRNKDHPLICQQFVLIALNVIGIARWLA